MQVTPTVALISRLEEYSDLDQVIIGTGSRTVGSEVIANPAFHGTGASAGIDVSPYARVLWRTELRGWRNADPLFPDGAASLPTKQSILAVTSLALTF